MKTTIDNRQAGASSSFWKTAQFVIHKDLSLPAMSASRNSRTKAKESIIGSKPKKSEGFIET